MLHLRRDQLKVALASDRIEWIRMTGWLKPKVVAQGLETIDTNNLADHSGDSKCATLLARLAEISKQTAWQNVDVTLYLSSGIARCFTFPKHATLKQPDELKALTQRHFIQIYGDSANNWVVKVSIGKTGENVASAVESRLLEGLREIFSKKQQKLISIQPALMASFNLHKKELPNKGFCWFVFSENGCLTYALLGDGQWKYVQTRRGTGVGSLLQWLERENLSGNFDMPCYEIWHAGIEQIDVANSPFNFHTLKAYSCTDIETEQSNLALYGGC